MSPHTLGKIGTHYTDKQQKVEGGGEGREKAAKCSTENAPSSHHTDQEAVQPKAQGIQHMHKYNKTTDNNIDCGCS